MRRLRNFFFKTVPVLLTFLLVAFFLPATTLAHGAFEASYKFDVPLVLGAATMQVVGQSRYAHMEPYDGSYSKNDLLVWDRPFAGQWNATAAAWSDGLLVAGLTPFALSAWDWKYGHGTGKDMAIQSLMIAEILGINSGVNLTVRSLRVWPRPFMLGESGGKERSTGQASGSFYSGHAANSFALATFTGIWYAESHPSSKAIPWVWAGGLSAAATIASLRVAAGKHWPTDVVVGALVGSAVGAVVPWMHRSQMKQGDGGARLSVAPQWWGVRWTF